MDEIKVITESSIASSDHPRSTIANFLSGKNIFITGATGFLGQCLIERLLSATRSIGKIYILVRGKHGFSPELRVTKLMSKAVSTYKFERTSKAKNQFSFDNFFHKKIKKMTTT